MGETEQIENTEQAIKALKRTEAVMKDVRWAFELTEHDTVSWERVAYGMLETLVQQQRLITWLLSSKVDK